MAHVIHSKSASFFRFFSCSDTYSWSCKKNADIKFIYEPDSNPPRGAFDIPANKNCEAKARGNSFFCSSLDPHGLQILFQVSMGQP